MSKYECYIHKENERLSREIDLLCEDIEARLLSMCWDKPELLKTFNKTISLRKEKDGQESHNVKAAINW